MVDVNGELSRSEFIALTTHEESLSDNHLLISDPNKPRTAIIRTSDRIAFKRCRRIWGWTSHLRQNLTLRSGISPLWFGTGIHFALEDFHGWNRFGHPTKAFEAFVAAQQKHRPDKLPEDWKELIELGRGMMDYYIIWLQLRKNTLLKTYWFNGEPQVEVNFRFRIPGDYTKFGYDEVFYSGTIDRICIDEHDQLWPLDYKSAKQLAVLHYLTDPQVGAYMWAAPHIYDKPIGGFIYQQHLKSTPNPGRLLKNGSVSLAQDQLTTHFMYRKTLIDVYGDVEKAPLANIQFLNQLAQSEGPDFDKFVRIDRIHRNDRSAQSEGAKIIMEIEDMLNPDLPLYPNPTRDCATMCSLLSPCTSLDDGSDWKHELALMTEQRESSYDKWRDKLVWPGEEKANYGDRDWLETDGQQVESDPSDPSNI